MRQFKTWHIVISGFMQNRGTPNGMVKLWKNLYKQHAGPDTVVAYMCWNDKFKEQAELIHRMTNSGPMPTICIYAYSWGAGHGAMKLARALEDRGIGVRCMVLSDPVFRPWLRLLAPLAMTRFPWIRIPRKVSEVFRFFQRENRPHGHRLVAVKKGFTEIHEGEQLKYRHQGMDDASEFHLRCHEVADKCTIRY